MSVPKAIFIDTSVYDAIKYDFESPTMKALIAEFEERKITLLCPAPINDEIKRHIREHSVSAINSLKSIGKENAFLRRLGNWPLNEKSHKELKEELENATNASYEAFRQNFESIDLGYDGVSVEEKEIEAILDAITLESHKIEAAINEASDIRNRLFKVTLGEPQLRNYGGVYRDDWKVVVPATSSDYTDPGDLIFDLPGGPTDPDWYLYVLMNAVGADEIADIEGTVVPMEVISGNPTVFWDALIESNEEDIDEPISEEEVDEIVESDVSPLDEAADSEAKTQESDCQATTHGM
jgi:hypothetical protein